MSNIYATEPLTKGKVILKTTAGDIDIELWAKEAPKAVRNFVQLCLEGYYDGSIFHRVIKDFMVQTGDPTGTGKGGESIYGKEFEDEFHSRLRFSHRGIIAMASTGPNTNSSQFFITLNKCEWLNKKNTIFGKITGDTLYNALEMGELETDKDDRPIFPPNIISTEVIWNPFEDIVPRAEIMAKKEQELKLAAERKPKEAPKAIKNKNLLSFEEPEDSEVAVKKEKIADKLKMKSSHDVLNDPRLLKEAAVSDYEMEISKLKQESKEKLKQAVIQSAERCKDEDGRDREIDVDFDSKMRNKILNRKREFDKTHDSDDEDDSDDSSSDKPKKDKKGTDENMRELKRLKREIKAIDKKKEQKEETIEPKGSYIEQQVEKYKKIRVPKALRQQQTLEKLNVFKKSLLSSQPINKAETTNTTISSEKSDSTGNLDSNTKSETPAQEDESTDMSWKSHQLVFERKVVVKDPMVRTDEEYSIYDPRKHGKGKVTEDNKHARHMRGLLTEKALERW